MKKPDTGTVLITGASSGIGKEFARIFSAEGFSPVLVARHRDKLEEVAQELKALHGMKVTILPADLNDPGSPRKIFASLREHGIEIEVLVNNAGMLLEGDFAAIEIDDHLRLLQLNIIALTALTRFFLPPMLSRGHGRILNVASLAAFLPMPRLAAYAASKAYVRSFSEALSEEVKGTGVTVTALCPGFTDTAMVRASPRAAELPFFTIMDAKTVAREGFAACLAGKALHVAGVSNDLFSRGAQHLPRSLLRAVGGFVARHHT